MLFIKLFSIACDINIAYFIHETGSFIYLNNLNIPQTRHDASHE